MKPTATGRHCGACQETVVDFTQMSDDEIVDFLGHHPAVRCGRFAEDQLVRQNWALPPATPVGWQRWATALVTVLGISNLLSPEVAAQDLPRGGSGGPAPYSTEQMAEIMAQQASSGSAAPPAPAPFAPAMPVAPALPVEAVSQVVTIRGVVRNLWGWPLEDARVRLGNTSTVTDAFGRFSLQVPAALLTENSGLQISHRGHGRKFVAIEPRHSGRYRVFLKRVRRVLMGSPRFR
jgi:hypothetical protein